MVHMLNPNHYREGVLFCGGAIDLYNPSILRPGKLSGTIDWVGGTAPQGQTRSITTFFTLHGLFVWRADELNTTEDHLLQEEPSVAKLLATIVIHKLP